jgi:hypothetical protein
MTKHAIAREALLDVFTMAYCFSEVEKSEARKDELLKKIADSPEKKTLYVIAHNETGDGIAGIREIDNEEAVLNPINNAEHEKARTALRSLYGDVDITYKVSYGGIGAYGMSDYLMEKGEFLDADALEYEDIATRIEDQLAHDYELLMTE